MGLKFCMFNASSIRNKIHDPLLKITMKVLILFVSQKLGWRLKMISLLMAIHVFVIIVFPVEEGEWLF